MTNRKRTISDAVRELMNHLPETEEFISHGVPTFRVRGKIIGNYTINHHGDGRVALNLAQPQGSQASFVRMDPQVYFVPSYTGPKGWLGIQLDQGLSWKAVQEHVEDVYCHVAPPSLIEQLDDGYRVAAPSRKFRRDEVNPLLGKKPQAFLKKLDRCCDRLPETVQGTQFGNPVWKAGKKTFVSIHYKDGRLLISCWVGVDKQSTLTQDPRYQIPQYTGHNGWIVLDIEDGVDWTELESLLLTSYRHFALKRMLRDLDSNER